MPGSLGRYYESRGGKTLIMGKPDPIIYRLALDDLSLKSHEIIAVGDSLEHDIAGAHAQKIDSLFIAGGIHAKDFHDSDGQIVVTDATVDRVAATGAFDACGAPKYCMDYLR